MDASKSGPLHTGTSSSLLSRIRAEESGAWDRLVTLYAPLVYHWCRRWSLREEDLADVFQEVFKALVIHVAGFRKQNKGDTFRGWLWTITRSKVLDHFRRKGKEPAGGGGTEAWMRLEQVAAPEAVEPVDPEETQAMRKLFLRGLELIRGEFEERTWRAFWRTAVEGRSPGDVAADLSMSPGAIRVAKSRVLQRLREELGDTTE